MLDVSRAVLPLCLLLLFYGVKKYLAYREIVRTIKYVFCLFQGNPATGETDTGTPSDWPGFRTVFSERFLYFPFRVRGISPGTQWPFYSKHADFARTGWDVVASVR